MVILDRVPKQTLNFLYYVHGKSPYVIYRWFIISHDKMFNYWRESSLSLLRPTKFQTRFLPLSYYYDK